MKCIVLNLKFGYCIDNLCLYSTIVWVFLQIQMYGLPSVFEWFCDLFHTQLLKPGDSLTNGGICRVQERITVAFEDVY